MTNKTIGGTMGTPIAVSGGVFIGYGCNGITRIGKCCFIPTYFKSNASEKEFNEDLQVFLDKWFTLCETPIDPASNHVRLCGGTHG